MSGVLFGVYVRVYVFRIFAHDEIVFILSQRLCVIALRRVRKRLKVWTEQTVCQNQY